MPLRLRRGTDAVRQTITPAEGELIYVTDTVEVWVGDGATPGGIFVTGEVPRFIDDLNDVDTSIGVSVNDFLAWDGVNFIPINIFGVANNETFQLNIEDNNNNLVVDFASSSHYGTFIGVLQGDVVGSVFSDNSTRIINGETGSIEASIIEPPGNLNINSSLGGQTRVEINSQDNRSILKLTRNTASDLTGDLVSQYGAIHFERDDINGPLVTGVIFGREDSIVFGNSADGVLATEDKYFVWKNNKFGIGVGAPTEALDVAGNANISGTLVAAALQGTLTLDDSTIVIDGITGNITSPGIVSGASLQGTLTLDDSTIVIDGIDGSIIAPSYVQFGSFTTTERNLLVAANGMVVYNTTTNKFNGYQNGAWINIDDGSAA